MWQPKGVFIFGAGATFRWLRLIFLLISININISAFRGTNKIILTLKFLTWHKHKNAFKQERKIVR